MVTLKNFKVYFYIIYTDENSLMWKQIMIVLLIKIN